MKIPLRLSLYRFLSKECKAWCREGGAKPLFELKSIIFHEGNNYNDGKYTS